MSMDRLSTELHYNLITLKYASQRVMTSFISHKSISHLDLQLCKRTLAHQREWFHSSVYPFSSVERSFFCSEESLRNHWVPKRRLLYTLNLDLPDGREYSSLRDGHAPDSFSYNPASLFVAFRYNNFPYGYWSQLITEAFEQTDCKFKLLKWIVDFRPLESICLPSYIQIFYAKHLYSECVDSEFAMKCFGKFIQFDQFSSTEQLKVLEHLLYHARLCDFDVRSKKSCLTSLTDYCLKNRNFACVQSILKYEDRPYYTEESYDFYKGQLFWTTDDWDIWDKISKPENHMSKLRLHRILQIIYIFDVFLSSSNYSEHVSEALRLIWSSIPDSFVCLKEMTDAYRDILPSEEISRAHSFYEEAIRQTDLRREPRSLSQYCRSIIRKILTNNKCWLPDGIKQLKLPPRFESFLNLQKDKLHPENFEAP